MNRNRFSKWLALLSAGVLLFSLTGCSPSTQPADTQPESSLSEESQPAVPDPVSVSFVSVGDNLIHSSIYQQANARAGGGDNYDFPPPTPMWRIGLPSRTWPPSTRKR